MATKTVAREAAGEPPATDEATGEAPGALIIDEKRPEASTITTLACLAAAGFAIVLLCVDAAVFFERRRSISAPLLSRVAPAALLPAKLLRDYLGPLNGAATAALASICGGTCTRFAALWRRLSAIRACAAALAPALFPRACGSALQFKQRSPCHEALSR